MARGRETVNIVPGVEKPTSFSRFLAGGPAAGRGGSARGVADRRPVSLMSWPMPRIVFVAGGERRWSRPTAATSSARPADPGGAGKTNGRTAWRILRRGSDATGRIGDSIISHAAQHVSRPCRRDLGFRSLRSPALVSTASMPAVEVGPERPGERLEPSRRASGRDDPGSGGLLLHQVLLALPVSGEPLPQPGDHRMGIGV